LVHLNLLNEFLECSGVRLKESRDWSDGGLRVWVRVKRGKQAADIVRLLEALPVGAWLQFFDAECPAVSDVGAFVQLTRHANDWSVAWSNYGWSSEHFSVPLHDAAAYMSRCYEVDWDCMMKKKDADPILFVHLTTPEKLQPISSLKISDSDSKFYNRLVVSK
jgi:hypothetical protein